MARLFTLLFFLTLTSCVSENKYNQVVQERDAVTQERDAFERELNDIKFSAPALLKDGKTFFAANDFSVARQKLNSLVKDHADRPEAAEAKVILTRLDEEESWFNARQSDEVSVTYQYLEKYPNGRYTTLATSRLVELQILAKEKDYESAVAQNTSSAWKQFLESYPDHQEATSIKSKIIRLEVAEIMAGEHGELPSSTAVSYGYSESSEIEITNNTGYSLTVRYSGPGVASVNIPVGGSRTVNLESGSYTVAATANGLHYAGRESLSGKYSSNYYITTRSSYQSGYSSPYSSSY